jgi:hypothetical protein
MASDLVKFNAESELGDAKKKEKEVISKKIIVKALYFPFSVVDPYLKYEKLIRQEQGKDAEEVIVVRKTSEEQSHVIPEDSLKGIEEFREKTDFEHKVSMVDLMHFSDISHKKNSDVLMETSMELLEGLARENIIVIVRDKQEIHQNFKLTEEDYAAFLSALRVETSAYRAIGQQLFKEFPELKRK